MDVVIAIAAASVASAFAVQLLWDLKSRPRPHVAVWVAAVSAFAVATWALVIGLASGWTEFGFRVFYWLGAIVNIPLFAAGAAFLVLGPRWGRRVTVGVVIYAVVAAIPAFFAPAADVAGVGIPEGSEVFDFTWEVDALTIAGPRVLAAVAGAVGTLVLVGLAAYSAIVLRRTASRRAWANLLIILGVLAPAFGGSLTALGESAGFSLSLLVGVGLLWAGYRLASGSGVQGFARDVPT